MILQSTQGLAYPFITNKQGNSPPLKKKIKIEIRGEAYNIPVIPGGGMDILSYAFVFETPNQQMLFKFQYMVKCSHKAKRLNLGWNYKLLALTAVKMLPSSCIKCRKRIYIFKYHKYHFTTLEPRSVMV